MNNSCKSGYCSEKGLINEQKGILPQDFNLSDSLSFYIDHLKNTLLPFWLTRSIDYEYGGYYTCFDNTGETLVSKDKYTWSQGRMVWVFSKLSSMECFSQEERKKFLELAKLGAEFLMKNCLLENGSCTFLMSREGVKKPVSEGSDLDISISADCFVISGLSRYAAVSGDKKALQFAEKLYESVLKRRKTGNYKTEPYPTPKGYKAHGGHSMTMLITSEELVFGLKALGNENWVQVDKYADEYMNATLDLFIDDNGVLHEMVNNDGSFVTDTLLGRYINPGHILEDMWFIIHQALEKENQNVIQECCNITKKTFDIGWDENFGGLLLFADQDGGRPKGSISGIENEKMVKKVLNDWSSKLWWPHSEALYTTLLAYFLTLDEDFLELYRKVSEYTFKTFPNPNKEIGEWIQIRDREGKPEQKVVALPVKDPFHIIRNVVLIIDLLEKEIRKMKK